MIFAVIEHGINEVLELSKGEPLSDPVVSQSFLSLKLSLNYNAVQKFHILADGTDTDTEQTLLYGGRGYVKVFILLSQYYAIFGMCILFQFTVMSISFSLTWERLWLDAQGFLNMR